MSTPIHPAAGYLPCMVARLEAWAADLKQLSSISPTAEDVSVPMVAMRLILHRIIEDATKLLNHFDLVEKLRLKTNGGGE